MAGHKHAGPDNRNAVDMQGGRTVIGERYRL